MNPFTKGRKVRAIRDTESRGGNADIGAGAVLEVSHTSDDSGHLFNAWHPNGIDVYALAKDDFEPVDAIPAPIDPHAIKAGDTVVVRFVQTGDVVTTKAYRPEDIKAGRWVSVLGWPLVKADGTFGLAVKHFELLEHQPAPEPEPEWEPGGMYEATVRGYQGIRVWRVEGGEPLNGWTTHTPIDSATWHPDADVTDVRPLVVIDPAAVDVEALAAALGREWSGKNFDASFTWGEIAVTVLAEFGIEATS